MINELYPSCDNLSSLINYTLRQVDQETRDRFRMHAGDCKILTINTKTVGIYMQQKYTLPTFSRFNKIIILGKNSESYFVY